MAELAPGIKLEVMRDQRLGGSYSHAARLQEILAQRESAPTNEPGTPPEKENA